MLASRNCGGNAQTNTTNYSEIDYDSNSVGHINSGAVGKDGISTIYLVTIDVSDALISIKCSENHRQ